MLARRRRSRSRRCSLFEDVHWADPTTHRLLGRLSTGLAGVPLLARPHPPAGIRPAAGPAAPHVTRAQPRRLTPAQSASCWSRLTGGKALPAGGRSSRSSPSTDGVPLFVEELTRTVLESGGLVEAGDRYVYAGRGPRAQHPRDAARLARRRGSTGWCAAKRDRPDRRGDRAQLQPRAASPPWPRWTRPSSPRALAQLTESGLACAARRAAPTRSTPSSTRWCRRPPTTRCSRASGGSCTPASPRRWPSAPPGRRGPRARAPRPPLQRGRRRGGGDAAVVPRRRGGDGALRRPRGGQPPAPRPAGARRPCRRGASATSPSCASARRSARRSSPSAAGATRSSRPCSSRRGRSPASSTTAPATCRS